MNPRSLAPGAFEGLKLMCREFGGFDANVLESAAASTVALGTDWQPIRDGAIAVMAETTARAVCADGIAVVPVQPPPQYVLALAWRDDEQAAAAHRCLAYLRRYRDRHRWLPDPDATPQAPDPCRHLIIGGGRKHSRRAHTETTASNDTRHQRTRPA